MVLPIIIIISVIGLIFSISFGWGGIIWSLQHPFESFLIMTLLSTLPMLLLKKSVRQKLVAGIKKVI